MEKLAANVPEVIKAASGSPLGILALIIILAALVGIYFFRRGPYQAQLLVFGCFVAGSVAYGWSIDKAGDKIGKVAAGTSTVPGPASSPVNVPEPETSASAAAPSQDLPTSSPASSSAQSTTRSKESRKPQCQPVTFENSDLQNRQEIPINGGACGGVAVLSTRFAGRSQFDFLRGQLAILDIVDQSGKNVCHRAKDQFMTFDLQCTTKVLIDANSTRSFTIIFDTKDVSDSPLPTLLIRYEMTPDAR